MINDLEKNLFLNREKNVCIKKQKDGGSEFKSQFRSKLDWTYIVRHFPIAKICLDDM